MRNRLGYPFLPVRFSPVAHSIGRRQAKRLPVDYFMITCSLPAGLRPLAGAVACAPHRLSAGAGLWLPPRQRQAAVGSGATPAASVDRHPGATSPTAGVLSRVPHADGPDPDHASIAARSVNPGTRMARRLRAPPVRCLHWPLSVSEDLICDEQY